MPSDITIQTNFTAGELTQLLLGQIGLEKYANGVEELENFIAQKHGGIVYRSGGKHIAARKNNTDETISVDFEFSTQQTYELELGNLYVRFYRDKSQLLASPGVPTEIATPYLLADLRQLKFTQSADVLYITHNDYDPRLLSRTAGDDTQPATWDLSLYDYIDGPYLKQNTTATTMKSSNNTVGAGSTITASAATFAATDINRLIRIKFVANWGYAKITAFTSSTVVTAEIFEVFDAGTPGTTTTVDWRLGAWADTTGVGWPEVSSFHQGSLFFANTPGQPQTLFKSVTNDFTNHQPSAPDGTVADDDGFVRTIDDNQVNAIWWLESDNEGLMILTGGGVHIGRTSNDFDPITPTNFIVRRHNNYAAHRTARPQRIGETVVYVTASGRKFRELKFELVNNRFVATDLAILSEHITTGGVKDTAYQQEPDSILWSVRNDGTLIGMTLERSEGVIAWHRHEVGGLNAEVESIGVIRDGTEDVLYMDVKRTVNGAVARTREFMEKTFDESVAHEDAFQVDGGVSDVAAISNIITGLDHLEGETVAILADGATHPEKVVSSGQVTLDYTALKKHAGLPYIGRVKSLPVVARADPGGGRGRLIRIGRTAFHFHRTLGGRFGSTDDNLVEIVWRTLDDLTDTPLALKTDLIVRKLSQPHGLLSRWILEQHVPQPFNLLQVVTEIQIADRI